MDSRSLTLLEFPAVRGRLAEATSFPPSRRLAEALEPSADPVIVARSLEETDQARSLIEDRPGVGIGAARDIGPAVERAARGGRLEPLQFLELADTLDATSRLATVLADDRRPLLHELARDLHSLPALRSTLARSFDPVGELLDTASPRLGGLRAAVRVAYDRLRRRLDSLVGAELGNALQEPIVTLRNGRYVVPVKAEARSRVKGIVHDASGSGQTLFIEPLVAVELGNAWREAQVAEAEEIARILDELSAFVAANAAALRETLGALARFDLWAAKASLAADMDATRAETADRPEVVLLSARHPGLAGRVVPIDIRLGDGYTALVVTGPNTGRQDGHAADARSSEPDAPGRAPHPGRSRQPASDLAGRLRRHRRRTVDRPVPVHVLGPSSLDHPDRRRGRAQDARPARRARRGHGSDRRVCSRPGPPRSFHPGRGSRGGNHPLRRAEGVCPYDARGAERRRGVRPRYACRRRTG